MHSLIDLNKYGGEVKIEDCTFENFNTCGAIIANRAYPDQEIMRNLQIDSTSFAADLNIAFDEDEYSTILSELADSLASREIDFEGFSQCEEDSNANPSFDTCFQIEIHNSEFENLNNASNIMKESFQRTGKDLEGSIVPQFLGYVLSLHQYMGSLVIHNNSFL